MRTTITIPDPLWDKIQADEDAKLYATPVEFIVQMLRNKYASNDAPKKYIFRNQEPKPTIEELEQSIPGLTTADKLDMQNEAPIEKPWGNARLHCNICSISPAASYIYEDENGDQHEGFFCKKHIEEYERTHGKSQAVFDTVKKFSTPNLSSFNGAIPKPKKEEKKKKW